MLSLSKLLAQAILASPIGIGAAFSSGAPRHLRLCATASPHRGVHRPPSLHQVCHHGRGVNKRIISPSTELPYVSEEENANEHEGQSTSTVLSQAALIAGTTIGGGFLALPAATAPCGAAPAAAGLIGVWLFLLGSALSLSNSIFLLKHDEQRGEIARQTEVSVFSLIRECFGSLAGVLGGLVFLLLVKVTLVAQLSKVGVLLEGAFPLAGRQVWTTVFSVAIATICLVAKQRRIERINDSLTATMLGSFATLVALAGGCGWSVNGLQRADYKSLFPTFSSSSASPWAIPIFIQLLLYNEVVPLVSSRLLGDQRKVRQAIIWGSSIPLLMCLVWSCVALGLVPYDPSKVASGVIYDPLTKLGDEVLSKGGSVVGKVFLASVGTLAGSAIGTTAIGSILASTQYFDDIIASLMRRTCGDTVNKPKRYQRLITHTLAVAPSAALAAYGSSDWYYRATSFAGEFPCTLLYGLIPPLCNLRLSCRRSKVEGVRIQWKDVATQVGLALVSLTILVISGASK